MTAAADETFIHQLVSYAIEIDGRFIVVERVPARVSLRTGERLFAPETVERLQKIVRGRLDPVRTMETPVFDFASAAA